MPKFDSIIADLAAGAEAACIHAVEREANEALITELRKLLDEHWRALPTKTVRGLITAIDNARAARIPTTIEQE